MEAINISLLVTAVANLVLGLFVYLTNSSRTVNRLFLFLSVIIAAWTGSVLQVVEADSARQAELWMRLAFVVVTFLPGGLRALNAAISHPDDSLVATCRRTALFWGLTLPMIVLSQTSFFLRGAYFKTPGGVPEASYGPGFALYIVWWLTACVFAAKHFRQDLIRSRGIERAELQFILLGVSTVMIAGTVTSFLIPLLSDTTGTSQFGPLSSVALMLIIAYGIAKYRIMDVTQLLRKATSYALLTASLVLLYAGVWGATHYVLRVLGTPSSTMPNLLAALTVAFSLAPAHGHMQRFANQLFINIQDVDIGESVRQASRILHSVTTLPDLLQRFSDMITQTMGTERVALLLKVGGDYAQKHPDAPGKHPSITLKAADLLVQELRRSHEPVVADALRRRRPTPKRIVIENKLLELRASIAVGIPSRDGLEGIMLLGPRLSGRIYGREEQEALQIICEQFAVSLENARLYTEAENGKIYNEILLDSLVSGVIAINAQKRITVFNREASRITGMPAADVLGKKVDALPRPLAETVRKTLKTGDDVRDQETHVARDKEEVVILVGSSIFRGHMGKVMGALLVLNDQTQVKKLEMQVRHTDRLASVGTLSAGMAHEIKNPLVSLKTFTQLLPERYDDPDFRATLSTLLDHEVRRIDSIVNQLLHFARPAKPELSPASLHQILDNSLRLVEQPLQQKGIKLHCHYDADRDRIYADSSLLDQAFVNFFLNAIEAMEKNGRLSVSTELLATTSDMPALVKDARNEPHIAVLINDTGKGIDHTDIASIFDPFFTTKAEGTGLGLSVTHGIIQEHEGAITVDSELMKGTTFRVAFPLIDAEDTDGR